MLIFKDEGTLGLLETVEVQLERSRTSNATIAYQFVRKNNLYPQVRVQAPADNMDGARSWWCRIDPEIWAGLSDTFWGLWYGLLWALAGAITMFIYLSA